MKKSLLISICIFTALLSPAKAENFRCTPSGVQAAYRAIVSQCGGSFNNAYRPGARIRRSGNASQHSFCDGVHGAVDINTSNRSCASRVGRSMGLFVINYGWGVHVGTDGVRTARSRRSRPVTAGVQ